MPETKYYVIEQTRRIRVTANNAVDAADIASASLDYCARNTEGWGHVTHEAEIVSLNIKAG